ncbi:MAG: ADP-ribosyltransferase [Bacteriophage sp.]|nr:MAG: ADP-ribosyltransferase [Bacteriophage sp.]
MFTDEFKSWFGDWTNVLKLGDIIFGHPAIGKTYSLETGKYRDKLIDWDVEFNTKRDKWIEEHSNTKKGTLEYKKARNEYLIYPEKHPDYVEFITSEWERVKNKTKKEGKILFASPHNLLKMFPQDFNRIINLEYSDFVSRNINRGGKEKESMLWKEGIDATISKIEGIPVETLKENQYFEDYLDKYLGISKVVDENGEPLIVYHYSDNPQLNEFSIEFDNYFSTIKRGTKKAIFFTGNSNPKQGTILDRNYKYPVFLNARQTIEKTGTKDELRSS